ncbi:MAG: prepilin-type N-terminal cleavage/methylation domain-containing protein, partial [Alphaproteobacteria bacterium]|nr:prepilin-type N-terminal cleavage/methylation domain-containing protein [Alphaproteobacteria bacterium]
MKNKHRGFTLVELAIVVAIAGLLFAGLWRLMSSGSGQLTEQAAAQQQQ